MRILVWHTSVFGSNDGVYRWKEDVISGLEELGHEVESGRWTNCKLPLTNARVQGGAEALIVSDAAWYSNPDFIPTVRRYSKLIPTLVFLHCPQANLKPAQQRFVSHLPGLATTSLQRIHSRRRGLPEILECPVFPYRSRLAHLRQRLHRDGLLSTSRIDLKVKRQHLPIEAGYTDPYDLYGDTVYTNAWKLADLVGAEHDPKGWGKPWQKGNVHYHGVFRRGILPDVAWLGASAHFTGTAPHWSVGGLEYATLEAIDAGRRAVVPEHMMRAYAYETPVVYDGTDWPCSRLDLWTALIRAVGGVLPGNDEIERDLAPHAPAPYAQRLLDHMLSI